MPHLVLGQWQKKKRDLRLFNLSSGAWNLSQNFLLSRSNWAICVADKGRREKGKQEEISRGHFLNDFFFFRGELFCSFFASARVARDLPSGDQAAPFRLRPRAYLLPIENLAIR